MVPIPPTSHYLVKCNSCKKILALEEYRRYAPSLTLVGRVKLILEEGKKPYLQCVCGQAVKLGM